MRTRTRAGLLTHLERLECRLAARDQPIKLRLGHLKRLPREYQGERHVIVARELPKRGDQEWVEFEEVPGPDPDPPEQLDRGHHITSMSCSSGLIPEQKKTSKLRGNQPAQASVFGKPRYVPGPGSSAS